LLERTTADRRRQKLEIKRGASGNRSELGGFSGHQTVVPRPSRRFACNHRIIWSEVKNAGHPIPLRSRRPLFCPTLRSSSNHPGLITKLRARMVDFNNPVTITREYCAFFTFPSCSGACSPNLLVCLRLRNSVACEALACPGWRIYVSLPAPPCFPSVIVILRL
jgi:hypothetical protein